MVEMELGVLWEEGARLAWLNTVWTLGRLLTSFEERRRRVKGGTPLQT